MGGGGVLRGERGSASGLYFTDVVRSFEPEVVEAFQNDFAHFCMHHGSTIHHARSGGIGCRRRYTPRCVGVTDGKVLGAGGTYAAACGCLHRSRGGDRLARGGESGRPRREKGTSGGGLGSAYF